MIDAKPELPIVVELDNPIEIKKPNGDVLDTVSSLTISSLPDMSMMEELPSNPDNQKMKHFFPIISGVCGIPLAQVRKLSMSDYGKVMGKLTYFLGSTGPEDTE